MTCNQNCNQGRECPARVTKVKASYQRDNINDDEIDGDDNVLLTVVLVFAAYLAAMCIVYLI